MVFKIDLTHSEKMVLFSQITISERGGGSMSAESKKFQFGEYIGLWILVTLYKLFFQNTASISEQNANHTRNNSMIYDLNLWEWSLAISWFL